MKKQMGLSVCVVVVSLFVASLATPSSGFAASFMGLGDLPGGITHSEAFDVSADGSVVVGYSVSTDGTEAFMWDAMNGMQSLNGPLIGRPDSDPPDQNLTAAHGVSADGNVIVGIGERDSRQLAFAKNLDGNTTSYAVVSSNANAVSGDGSIVVGSMYSQAEFPAGIEAFLWGSHGMVGIGDFPGGEFYSVATDVSDNGSVIVGYGTPESATGQLREAFIWDSTYGMRGIGFLSGTNESEATGVSADGNVVVGNSGRYNVFRYDNQRGMIDLGPLPGGSTFISAQDVSADGSVIVGGATTPQFDREPFLWDDKNGIGMQNLRTLLEDEGIDLTGWRQLGDATAVSADGSIIVGYGIKTDNTTEAWIAKLGEPSVPNSAPIANAGNDETVHPGTTVTLNGSGSTDPEENYPLTYAWSIVSKPSGSAATLSGADTVSPSFVPDKLGDYIVELIVTDNLDASSAADQVLISTDNTAPVAEAGDDQAVVVLGTTIQLNGSQSYDLDGDYFSYSWSFTSKPEGSNANLNNAAMDNPTFIADIQGDYILSLVVTDIFGASNSDTVRISFDNVKPIAIAGDNRSVVRGATVYINGSGSSDANGDPLTYSWSFASRPDGSTTDFIDSTSPLTSFIADIAGTYVISLVVNDGLLDSDPSNIEVFAISTQDAATESLQEAMDEINAINVDQLKNDNMKNALTNKINAVFEMIARGNIQDAIDKLQNDILDKTNGCHDTGEVDKNDWILNCVNQNVIYQNVMETIEYLTQ